MSTSSLVRKRTDYFRSDRERKRGRCSFVNAHRMIAGLDQPVRLRAVGINRESLDDLAKRALDYQAVRANPRPISNAQDMREVLDLDGKPARAGTEADRQGRG